MSYISKYETRQPRDWKKITPELSEKTVSMWVQGASLREIKKEVGISHGTLSRIINKDESIKEEKQRLRKEALTVAKAHLKAAKEALGKRSDVVKVRHRLNATIRIIA